MSEPNSKHPYLDSVAKNFLENLNSTNKAIYEMTADESREFLKNIQKKILQKY